MSEGNGVGQRHAQSGPWIHCGNCTAPIRGGGFKCHLCLKTICNPCRQARSCCNDSRKPKSSGFLDAPLGGHANDTTSRAAAEKAHLGGKAEEKHRKIFSHLRALGDEGATDHEGHAAVGMHKYGYAPHRYELVQEGLVKDSGRTRPTDTGSPAIVWVTCAESFRPVENRHRLSKAKVLELKIAELEGTIVQQARLIRDLRAERVEPSGQRRLL